MNKYKKGWKELRQNQNKMNKQFCDNALSHYEDDVDCTPHAITIAWIVMIAMGVAISAGIVDFII